MNDIGQLLQNLIAGGNRTGIYLEAALGDDEPREFLGDVDVGGFQRFLRDAAASAGKARADQGGPRAAAQRIVVVAVTDEGPGIRERRQSELRNWQVSAVGED